MPACMPTLGLALALALVLSFTTGACAPKAPPMPATVTAPEAWGIDPVGLFLLERGNSSEFRYRVVDSQDALRLFSRPVRAMLVRQNGERYELPLPVRAGNLSLLEFDPDSRRVHFMRFYHPIFPIHRGERISLLMGDMLVQDLEVRDFNDMPASVDRAALPPLEPETFVTMPEDEPRLPFPEDVQ